MAWLTIWICLMMAWILGGCYLTYRAEPSKPYALAGVVLPWLCVLIIGLVVFGAIGPVSWR